MIINIVIRGSTYILLDPWPREKQAEKKKEREDERSRSAGNCSEHVPRTQKALRAAPGALIEDRFAKQSDTINRTVASRYVFVLSYI